MKVKIEQEFDTYCTEEYPYCPFCGGEVDIYGDLDFDSEGSTFETYCTKCSRQVEVKVESIRIEFTTYPIDNEDYEVGKYYEDGLNREDEENSGYSLEIEEKEND